jgi:hypothetical protein
MVLKVISNTVAIGTSNNNIFSARLVRIQNTDTSLANVAVWDVVGNTLLYFVQVSPSEIVNLEKNATDALTSNNSTKTLGTSIAYRSGV